MSLFVYSNSLFNSNRDEAVELILLLENKAILFNLTFVRVENSYGS